jgi:hypothetical protein
MRFAYFYYKILMQIMNFQNCDVKGCIFADQNERFILNNLQILRFYSPLILIKKFINKNNYLIQMVPNKLITSQKILH